MRQYITCTRHILASNKSNVKQLFFTVMNYYFHFPIIFLFLIFFEMKKNFLPMNGNIKDIVNLINFNSLNTMMQLVYIENVKNIVIFQVKILFIIFFTISMTHDSFLETDFYKVEYSM